MALLAELGHEVVAVTGKTEGADAEWLKKLGANEVRHFHFRMKNHCYVLIVSDL